MRNGGVYAYLTANKAHFLFASEPSGYYCELKFTTPVPFHAAIKNISFFVDKERCHVRNHFSRYSPLVLIYSNQIDLST